MTNVPFPSLIPWLLPVAALFALLGWWLRGKKTPPASALPVTAKSAASPSNSERQRLRDLEAKLRASESTAAASAAELTSFRAASIAKTEHDAALATLETTRIQHEALEIQLRKSRDVQAGLQSQANDAGKKVQARAIALENELSTARTEIQRLKTLSDPNTEGMKRLEGEIETVRTRLRAVEAQLSERNAELSALQARSRTTTARPPRTIAARDANAGGALDLLGFESTANLAPPTQEAAAAPARESAVPLPETIAASAPVLLETAPSAASPADSLASAAAILGKSIAADDLTVIEGIGPDVRDALDAASIRTWADLAAATSGSLAAALTDAGSSLAALHPETWPEQARLASDAKWFQLKSLQEKIQATQTALV